MANISLRVGEEEQELIEAYAKLQGVSVSELLRRAILEKIEEEFDVTLYDKAYKAYEESGRKTYTVEEARKELGL